MPELEFKMMGPVFDDGVPLHLVTEGLTELQSILDKPYLHLENKQRIFRKDRQSFYIKATSIRQGCLIADLDIIYQTAQLVLPGVMAYGPDTVWNYTRETWGFLKLIYERAKKGETPSYQTNDNGTTTVVYGDGNYTFNGPVTVLAQASIPHYKKLTSLLKVDGVNSVHLGNADTPEVVLDASSKDLFKLDTKIDTDPIAIDCEVFDFNKHSNGGKLKVAMGEAIDKGEYSFTVFGRQGQSDYIYSMLQPRVNIKCLKEVQIDPLGETKVVRLHILEIIP
ncbi:hypothetical protein [Oceanicoccus sagamiensis]|uniref:Uncharacterized protein n=1 Tax=Oceanicoccus sagamiensis TaxID=716816 RepID=A0A1X9NHC8_9GAMM|nr:hypothetical protein [Oceanicoccus sagamiensis]ARN75255.1 hypothetical protein BST96_14710 [Oceanicoccus sagamiensis]